MNNKAKNPVFFYLIHSLHCTLPFLFYNYQNSFENIQFKQNINIITISQQDNFIPMNYKAKNPVFFNAIHGLSYSFLFYNHLSSF